MSFFPPDVSLRVSPDADVDAAQKLFPAAKQLLFRALNMKQAGMPVVRLFLHGTDGSLVYVYLIEHLKHVYVQPGRVGVTEEQREEVEDERVEFRCPDVLSGVVYPGEPVLLREDPETGRRDYAVHEFHPSPIASSIYSLPFTWSDVERLGVEADHAVTSQAMQVRYPKPSMYSGAMKRIVQSIYGIGKTSYVDQIVDPLLIVDMEVQNHYHYEWLKTDGVFKFDGKYWLIRIGKDDGVLAMRLEFFECSTRAYAAALRDIGDTETAAIVEEFNGLPTGRSFPSDIDAAVASGRVLRLLSSAGMAPFYQSPKHPFFAACGWAFSNSGEATSAHNTCWWYSRPDIVALPFTSWATDGFANADPLDRYMRAEHWKVELSFVKDSEGQITASAQLIMVEVQPLEAPNSMNLTDLKPPVDALYPKAVGHYPVTGVVGRSGPSGEIEWPVITNPALNALYPEGVLLASGMDPIRFADSFTPPVGGGPDSVQAGFLSHASFMVVPRNDASGRLDRFKFWGRSQANIRMADIEPAYEAPVLVFYVGEELEIVRRKADRYQSDREVEAAFDDVPGTYYPGDFFGTSLNLLDPIRTHLETQPGNVSKQKLRGFYHGPPQFAAVGLIIPAGCREGYVFVKAQYDENNGDGIGAEVISYRGFFADLGEVELNEYVSNHDEQYTVPDFGDTLMGKYETSVMTGWWSMWTNLFFDWNLGIDNTGVRFSVSISATSKNCAMNSEPELGWRLLDVPFTYRLSLPAESSRSAPGLPAVYRYTLPEGIALDNANPTEITFVGGV